ncbi:MAG: hypothetical protein U0694_18500 [Anaerolineae bacterium]
MSEEQNQPRGGVRRVGRKDQKKKLSSPDSLFPLEDFVDEEELATQAHSLSLAREANEEAEEAAATRPTEAPVSAAPDSAEASGVMDFAPPSADDARFAPPLVTTPYEERFPPVDVKIKEPPAPSAPPPEKAKRGFTRQDAIALLFAFGTLGLCAYFTFIWFNPYSALNPAGAAHAAAYRYHRDAAHGRCHRTHHRSQRDGHVHAVP